MNAQHQNAAVYGLGMYLHLDSYSFRLLGDIFLKRSDELKQKLSQKMNEKDDEVIKKFILNRFTDDCLEFYEGLSDTELLNYLCLLM
jgi:hypothetical protein